MTLLTANYSISLAKLIHSKDAPVDGIEVGPWFTPEKIKSLQQELSEWPFQFHASSFMTRYQYRRGALERLNEYLACTQSQWISLHIELLPVFVYVLSARIGLHLPPLKIKRAINNFVRLLSEIKNRVEIPIILENLPSLPLEKYAYAADPSLITEIVNTTNSGFLLDIPHARVAASHRRMSVENYLEKLPLKQTIQIHVSGARDKDGYLHDTHEVMQDEDYAILKWVLGRSKPKVVTLEYFRELGKLQEQLLKLREILAD
jgi:uncharacterized protein (UPF0276 family)